jgi:valine--pyruvate aminotransferase
MRGREMTRLSGIRSIMEDIATADAAGPRTTANLSPGNPCHIPEVVATWEQLVRETLDEQFCETSTRYGPSRGTPALVEAVVAYFNAAYGWSIRPENVLVGPGSQLLSFIATTLFTGQDEYGDIRRLVLPRTPDYAGYQGLSLDHAGIVGVEPKVSLEGERFFRYRLDIDAVQRLDGIGMMLLSNPSNPSGSTIDTTELTELIAVAKRHDAPLVIDHAYGEPFPRIAPSDIKPVLHSHVINLFTLSKAGLPAERIAFAIGPAHLIDPMVSFVANSVLHAPQLLQATVARALAKGDIDTLTAQHITPCYTAKRALAERLLAESLPAAVNWRLHSGERGMFCWLLVDHHWFDDLEFYGTLKRNGVFIVPGRHFFTPPLTTPFLRAHATRCFRLSLSPNEDELADGIRRLSAILGGLVPDSSGRG